MITRIGPNCYLIGIYTILYILIAMATSLHADIYVHVDSDGVLHFTNVPTSSKSADYKVYIKESPQKPLNSYNMSKKIVYENEEFNLLQAALDIEDGLENLRYNNIVIATDADVDGMHIRLLLITFFLQFFPELIKEGHLYILDTPLFRVRDKKQTFYCYSPEEKENAINSLKGKPEMTRFKGLGEISPDEFVHFIGDDIRLDPVMLDKEMPIDKMLEFYMGKNTPDRQKFIIKNLKVELDIVEE